MSGTGQETLGQRVFSYIDNTDSPALGPGTLANSILKTSPPIPGGTIVPGDILQINTRNVKGGGTTSNTSFSLYINTVPSLSGATLLIVTNLSNSLTYNPVTNRALIVKSPTKTEIAGVLDTVANGTVRSILNIDWTIPQYIMVTGSIASGATDTILCSSLSIVQLKSS